MVRALAGDSTMTRFLGTGGSVAPGPCRTLFRPRGSGAGSPRRSRDRVRPRAPVAGTRPLASSVVTAIDGSPPDIAPGGISTNRMCRYGKKKIEATSSTKTGRLPFIWRRFVQRTPTSPGVGRLEQVGEQRLLVVEVQDDVPDHDLMVARAGRPVSPPKVRSGVVEVDHEADPPAGDPDADPDPVVRRVHQVDVVAAAGRLLAWKKRCEPRTAARASPDRQPMFSAQR